jgi:hypothetical protein
MSDVPPMLKGRTALDVAALLRINPSDPEWSIQIDSRMKPIEPGVDSDDEEAQFLSWEAERQAACREYLRALFPNFAADLLKDAWERAVRLDEATTRSAKKQYGYPSSEHDAPPDPRAECPGFSEDVYGYVYNRVMTDLR